MSEQKYVLLPTECDDVNENTNEDVYPPKRSLPRQLLTIICLLIFSLYIIYMQSFMELEHVAYTTEDSMEIIEIIEETTQHLSTSPTKFTNSTWSPSVKPTIVQEPKSQTYFIYTSQCRVPYVDPFGEGVSHIYNPKKFKYTNCTKDEALITSNFQRNTSEYILHMNTPAIERAAKVKNVSAANIRCCYRQIVRSGSGKTADGKFKLYPCSIFHQDFKVPQHIDYIITECYILNNQTQNVIQKDAFSFIQQQNVKDTNSSKVANTSIKLKTRKPSVLLLGIDSLSRINLRRTMPETFHFLQNNHWFELQGYNKVGDNTFPNLMALLSSYNLSTAENVCKPKTVGGLNNPACNLIWNNFKQYGYKTAFAEDSYWMSTFNYLKKGFLKPPTDYYLRPMMMAVSRNLKSMKVDGLEYCIGRKHQGEYIFDYALQLANAFPTDPIFGMFWTNSFSHNSFDTTARMDVKVLEYLKRMQDDGILERSIVLFFADHGVRWGPSLELKSGFLEERLPMMFISVPTWYQNENPNFINALQINQNRLTSPYDIYATLKHLLEETDSEKQFPYLNGTIRGLSLFHEIPENRTCIEAGITDHWCTCIPYEVVSTKDSTAINVTGLVINEINHFIESKNISNKCSSLVLAGMESVKKKMYDGPNQSTYRITFIANPNKPKFQATAVYDKISRRITTNVEEISRVNTYSKTSGCIDLKEAKKFCICKGGKEKKN